MSDRTITSPDGEILRRIAKTKTTPHSDNSVKPINTDSTTIELLVFDGRMISTGSQWGHVAIDIDGRIYTRAHDKYAVVESKRYRASNQSYREFEGLLIRVSPDEKQKIETELRKRVTINEPYSLVSNSCSTNVADVLEMIGILAHDPRFKIDPISTDMVSPKEVLIVVSRSKRVVKRINYPILGKE